MTRDEIALLRRLARERANQARSIHGLVSSQTFMTWADRTTFEVARAVILAVDYSGFIALKGPAASAIRAEAQRMKLEDYWSRPVEPMLDELTKNPLSVFYKKED